MTVLAGGQGGSGYAEGLADALGQRALALRNRSLALVVTAASWVDTASAAAVALGWLPMFFSVICSLTRAELSASISVFHSPPASVLSRVTSARTRATSVLSLSSASPLADRCPTWAMADRRAATSGQTTDEGLGDGLLAAVLPPDEQPAPSSAIAATRHAPASPALMPGTLPPARARVLTRAGLVALLAALRVISMIDFYVPCGPCGQTGQPPGPRDNSMIDFTFPADRADRPGKSPPRTHVLREKSGWPGTWPAGGSRRLTPPTCAITP